MLKNKIKKNMSIKKGKKITMQAGMNLLNLANP